MSSLLLLLVACSAANAANYRKRDSSWSYLPYFQLSSSAAQLIPRSSTETDICSSPIEVPGGLPFGNIRATNISVCENGVILTEPDLLRSSLCVCRGEFPTCEDAGDSVYAIAPFWSDVNNVSATDDAGISYQVFTEDSGSHDGEVLERIWAYIAGQVVLDSIQFFPKWVLVSHWENVHPYVRPNEIDPRTNTFQAVVATDGTQTYTVFTYNCSDLNWSRTPNSFVASDCSFIGVYSGGGFEDFQSETTQYGLQVDSRTANISRAAGCSRQETSWNNFLFILTPQRVINVTARAEVVAANIGDFVTMQFSVSTFVIESLQLEFWFKPECQCGDDTTTPFEFPCDDVQYSIEKAGIMIDIVCRAAILNVTVSNVIREAFGDYVVSITTSEAGSDVAFSNLTLVDEVTSGNLVERTSDPSSLTSGDITSATSELQDLQTSAITNENVRQNYLQTIDNLMQADGDSIVQSQMENNSSSKILDSLQQFTLQVPLPANATNETFVFDSYGFQLFDVDPATFEARDISTSLGPLETVKNVSIPVNITFSGDRGGENVAVYVQVAGGSQDDSDPYRVSVVVYRQENLFQNDASSSNGTSDRMEIESVVVSVSSTAGDASTLTMGFHLIPDEEEEEEEEEKEADTSERTLVCSNFNTGGNGGQGSWSGDNCEEVQCSPSDSNFTCCECHIYGHFGLLLAVTPVVLDEELKLVLVVFSYIGAGISILCLTVLLVTYIFAKKLRSSTSGKLLINLATSLLAVYVFFIVGGHIRPYGDTRAVDIACGASSALLQYFMLVYFGWTAAEALNLYFSLVKVFEAKTIRHYTLKAGLVVWLVPAGVVAIAAGVGHTYYINDVYCRPVEWPFYFSFVLPIAVILVFDCLMFARIMVSLYRHTRQTERLQNREQSGTNLQQIKKNARYAIVLVTLFGLGWIFGLVVTGYPEAPMAVTFTLQFIFCLFVSAQGLLLFLFQVAFSRDAKDFWTDSLTKCFPSLAAKKTKPVQMKKKTIMNRLTGIFRAPKYTERVMHSSPDHNNYSTLERSGRISSANTESFEASFSTQTLQRGVKTNTLSPPTNPATTNLAITNIATTNRSMDNLISEMTTSEMFLGPEIDFDTLSLRDDF